MTSVSLWAVPIGARTFQKKYNAKQVPHVTLMDNLKPGNKPHELFPTSMKLKAQTNEMVVRKVKDKYEYGWVFDYNDGPVFMTCHEVNKGEIPAMDIRKLDEKELNTIVTYSVDGFLVDPSDLDTTLAYDSDENWL